MNWRNALIGAIIGFLILKSPIGALIGVLLAQWIGPRWPDQRAAVVPPRLIDPFFALAGALAKADGRVSTAEVAATEQWMQRLRLDKAGRRRAIQAFENGKAVQFDAQAAARELARFGLVHLDLKLILLGALDQIAGADGGVHPAAAGLHARIVAWLEVPEPLWRQTRSGFDGRPSAAASDSDYALLGLTIAASDAELRRRYRQLLARHHPDKLARDAGPAERALAEEKTRNLIAAYERIKSARGMV